MVKYSPHARAIRDVEDEELRSFFYGMSPWQVLYTICGFLYVRVRLMIKLDEQHSSGFWDLMFLQFILIVTASSIGEELFYRAAVQVIP